MSANVSTRKPFFPQIRIGRSSVFGAIIITALCAFELFNYSTTEYALSDLLGGLRFAGIRWATILSIAFCGIDFAGIARLFTPQANPKHGSPIHNDTWYLFGAWLLAATMNAILTWWGVSLAIAGHDTFGAQVVERSTLLKVVPIFVSLLVWLIRVLIIGTFSVGGESLMKVDPSTSSNASRSDPRSGVVAPRITHRPQAVRPTAQATPITSRATNRTEIPQLELTPPLVNTPTPTYHPLSASASRNLRDQRRSEMREPKGTFRH